MVNGVVALLVAVVLPLVTAVVVSLPVGLALKEVAVALPLVAEAELDEGEVIVVPDEV